MSAVNPYATLLREVVDPIIDQALDDMPISSNEILKVVDVQSLTGVQIAEGGIVSLYQHNARSVVMIGDAWRYKSGNFGTSVGELKFKKMTLAVTITEDEKDRIQQNGMNSMIAKGVRDQMRNSILDLHAQISKWTINPWQGVTTDTEYDSKWFGFFAKSSTGTLTNPSDMNPTAGTAIDLSAINFSGTNQTVNSVAAFLAGTKPAVQKIDYYTKRIIPMVNLHIGMHPTVYEALDSSQEILSNTTYGGMRSEKSIIQLLESKGYTIVQDVYFDPDYSYASGTTSELVVFADPKRNFTVHVNDPPGGQGWTDWKETPNNEGGELKYEYTKRKKIEFACEMSAYYINTSATAASLFKPVFHVTVTPYEDS